MKRLQTGDIDYKEASAVAAVRNKIELDGVTTEQNAATMKVRHHKKSSFLKYIGIRKEKLYARYFPEKCA